VPGALKVHLGLPASEPRQHVLALDAQLGTAVLELEVWVAIPVEPLEVGHARHLCEQLPQVVLRYATSDGGHEPKAVADNLKHLVCRESEHALQSVGGNGRLSWQWLPSCDFGLYGVREAESLAAVHPARQSLEVHVPQKLLRPERDHGLSSEVEFGHGALATAFFPIALPTMPALLESLVQLRTFELDRRGKPRRRVHARINRDEERELVMDAKHQCDPLALGVEEEVVVAVELAPVLHLKPMLARWAPTLAVLVRRERVAEEIEDLAARRLREQLEGRPMGIRRPQHASAPTPPMRQRFSRRCALARPCGTVPPREDPASTYAASIEESNRAPALLGVQACVRDRFVEGERFIAKGRNQAGTPASPRVGRRGREVSLECTRAAGQAGPRARPFKPRHFR
jgi:hypothetical protein